jgi:hypothetical protein
MHIQLAKLCLTLSFLAAATPALAEIFDGTVTVDAQIESEQAEVVINGKAAYGIFWVTAFRMRLEDLAPDVRRARGRDITCYAYGPPTDAIEDWLYSCRLNVGEFGEIVAPPIPVQYPLPSPQPEDDADTTR